MRSLAFACSLLLLSQGPASAQSAPAESGIAALELELQICTDASADLRRTAAGCRGALVRSRPETCLVEVATPEAILELTPEEAEGWALRFDEQRLTLEGHRGSLAALDRQILMDQAAIANVVRAKLARRDTKALGLKKLGELLQKHVDDLSAELESLEQCHF